MKKWRFGMSLLATCGMMASAGSLEPAFGATNSSSVVHLTFWTTQTGIWYTFVKNLADEFNKTHSNIQVQTISVPTNVDQKVLTAIAAGSPPDIFQETSPTVGAFAQKNALVDLGQYMRGAYAGMKQWFYPNILNWATYKSNVYGIPMDVNDYMLYYNKDLMKAAGLNPNKPPRTIAQLDADQSKLWKFGSGGVVRQIGFYPGSFDDWIGTFNAHFINKNGRFDMLTPNTVKLMNWISSFKKYPYSQVSSFIRGVGSNDNTDPFVAGKQAFMVQGPWETTNLKQYNPKLHYGVTPLPAPSGGYYGASNINGDYLEVPSGSKHPKEAFEFIAWIAGYHNEKWWANAWNAGEIPNSRSVAEQPGYQAQFKEWPLRKPFIDVMQNKHNAVIPVSPADEVYENTMTNDMTAVLEGKMSVKAALKDVQAATNKDLSSK